MSFIFTTFIVETMIMNSNSSSGVTGSDFARHSYTIKKDSSNRIRRAVLDIIKEIGKGLYATFYIGKYKKQYISSIDARFISTERLFC